MSTNASYLLEQLLDTHKNRGWISPQLILGKHFADIENQNVACNIVDKAMDQLITDGELGHPYSLIFSHHVYQPTMQYLVLRGIKERFYRPVGPAAVGCLLPYSDYLQMGQITPAGVEKILKQAEKELEKKIQHSNWGKIETKSNGIFTLEELEDDLFRQYPQFALAHCVSRDFRMSKGIALLFKRAFGNQDTLKSRGAKVGEVVELKKGGNYILYAITKEHYNDKPSIKDFVMTMKALAAKCDQLKIKKIAVPRLGCGLDKLEWPTVKQSIIECFRDHPVTVRVCTQKEEQLQS
ncbi:unnamed protein product [Allacma fusca]|uniref:Macro domain-containing protein n=1 Tax=Allacma fusca TaxID=39272 RepID=A0A8J2P7H5_9HEXA|nr:unnamed protein product [Allacma fusca]